MKNALIKYVQNPKFDDIYTPDEAIYPLLKYIPKNITIWECCDNEGDSNITKLLKKYGYNVISTGKKEDFIHYEQKEDFDMIITNPPYSLKDEFIKKCYEWKKPFCLLLPITALEGKTRNKMYKQYGIEILVFNKRINFMKDKKGSWFNTSWFCHNVLPEKIIFEELGDNND